MPGNTTLDLVCEEKERRTLGNNSFQTDMLMKSHSVQSSFLSLAEFLILFVLEESPPSLGFFDY